MNPPADIAETIAAIATPPGRGGIGVLRVSGPRSRAVAEAVLGRVPRPRRAEFRAFRGADGTPIDRGIALFFPAPRSFTGEDVLELQGHGGPVVLDMLLQRVLALGARPARPGEFSERAFLNGRIDLAQAEAIADLIDSASEEAARSALRSLQGEFSRRVHDLVARLTELRVHVEAAIDFPEEEIDILTEGAVTERIAALREGLAALIAQARQGCLIREGMTVVIAGPPNAGKSSLLNRLARCERAIVTDIPGTTRDVLREPIAIDGLPLHVIDTAGLRESSDPVERIGVERAWEEIARADRVLLVVDDSRAGAPDHEAPREGLPGDRLEELMVRFPDRRCTVVHNKIDLSGAAPRLASREDGSAELWLSARTGAGMDLLRQHLKACRGYQGGEGVFTARRRHLAALARAHDHLERGLRQLAGHRAAELAAEDLRLAQRALGEITGEVTSEDLLGRIFSSFCIGK